MDNGLAAALERRQPKVPQSCRLDGAGEAQLLQRAQSTPPAGQARGTLRMLARERVARGGIPHPLRDGAPRAKKRTDALATDAAVLSAGTAGGGLRDPDASGAGPL